jgi:hypothetical protein
MARKCDVMSHELKWRFACCAPHTTTNPSIPRLDVIFGAMFSWSNTPASSSLLTDLTFLARFWSRGLPVAFGGVTLSGRFVESAKGIASGETEKRDGESMNNPLRPPLGVSERGRRPPFRFNCRVASAFIGVAFALSSWKMWKADAVGVRSALAATGAARGAFKGSGRVASAFIGVAFALSSWKMRKADAVGVRSFFARGAFKGSVSPDAPARATCSTRWSVYLDVHAGLHSSSTSDALFGVS